MKSMLITEVLVYCDGPQIVKGRLIDETDTYIAVALKDVGNRELFLVGLVPEGALTSFLSGDVGLRTLLTAKDNLTGTWGIGTPRDTADDVHYIDFDPMPVSMSTMKDIFVTGSDYYNV